MRTITNAPISGKAVRRCLEAIHPTCWAEIFGQPPSPDGKPVASLQPLIETHANAISAEPVCWQGSTCGCPSVRTPRHIGIELLERITVPDSNTGHRAAGHATGPRADNWFEPEAA
nr:hypothetical protein [Escherichia coli O25b:H4-ST131]